MLVIFVSFEKNAPGHRQLYTRSARVPFLISLTMFRCNFPPDHPRRLYRFTKMARHPVYKTRRELVSSTAVRRLEHESAMGGGSKTSV